jgi:hypothetical protein
MLSNSWLNMPVNYILSTAEGPLSTGHLIGLQPLFLDTDNKGVKTISIASDWYLTRSAGADQTLNSPGEKKS